MARRLAALLLVLDVATPTRGAETVAAQPNGFARCEEAVRDHPERKESYRCFWEVARAERAWDEAVRRLQAHLAPNPANPNVLLSLAAVEWDRGADRTEHLYREAAEGFAGNGDRNGEVFAWMGLAGFLRQRARASEAEPVLERALASARASGDQILVARVRIDQTVQAFARSDFGEALRLTREAEQIAVASNSKDLRARVLGDRAYAYWALAQYRKGLEAYSAQADLLHEMGALFEEARARYSVAVLANSLRAEGLLAADVAARLARESLDAAIRSGNRVTEAKVRVLLSRHLEAPAAIDELERALTLARAMGDREASRFALRLLALRSLLASPARVDEAFRFVEQAASDARSSGSLEDYARALSLKAVMRHRTGPREQWTADTLTALDAIERIRDLQPEGTVRARAFSPWTFAYSRFSAQLLEELTTSGSPRDDLELAFATLERMRARVLLDELERAGTRPALDRSSPELKAREDVLNRISRLQRSLLDRGLSDGARRAALTELDRLEEEEVSLRDAIARAVPEFARWRPSAFPGLAAVQARLGQDQALLSFALAPVSAEDGELFDPGDSWVILVTRDATRPFRLPSRAALEDRIAVFLGLCRRGDGSETRAAARLFADLLGPALREAGPSIRRLVLVPDGAVNQVPFGALREEASAPPLAMRYEIESVASATLWLRNKAASEHVPFQALILADPRTGGAPTSPDTQAAVPWMPFGAQGRLPHARREARALARALGPGSRVLVGEDAAEDALGGADLRSYGLVYFAAHAVVDAAHPERSAVFLAPGRSGEDGLLQIREIVHLTLSGHIVVLSSCRSAAGAELAGEGVLSLVRAFFQAGARAVVGTLWPVRDDDAAVFMRALAAQLGRGLSLAAAHAEAGREAIGAGMPVSAWAGFVVFGDGDVVLRRDGHGAEPSGRSWVLPVVLTVLVGAMLAGAWLRSRRRTNPTPSR